MNEKTYITVEGPEKLKEALLNRWEKSQTDPQDVAEYFLYKLLNQESLILLIRVGSSFYIFHYDLRGRSATKSVQEIIHSFLRDRCGSQGHFEDVSGREMLARNMASFLKADGEHGRVVLSSEKMTLTHAWQQLEHAAAMVQRAQDSAAKAREHFGLFHQVEHEQPQESAIDRSRNKPGKSGLSV